LAWGGASAAPWIERSINRLHPWPNGRRRAGLIWSNVRTGAKGPGSAVDIDRRHTLGCARVDGPAAGLEVVVAAAVRLVVDQQRIGIDGVHILQSMLQDDALGILPDQVVDVLVPSSGHALFADRNRIVADDVVGHKGVVIRDTAGSIAISHNDSTFAVSKHKVVGNHHIVGSMPEMDSPSRVAVGDVVEDVATEIRMIDTLNRGAVRSWVTDVMNHVADNIVVAGVEGGIVDAGATVAVARRGNVMDVVANDTYERGIIFNAHLDTAGDVKADDIHVVSGVDPDRSAAAALELGTPLYVRDKTDTSACSSADATADRPVGARGDVHDRSGCDHIGCVLDCRPGSGG